MEVKDNMKKEKQEEIIDLCELVLENYKATRKVLSVARSYGILDFIGGGIISSLLKRNKINEFINSLNISNKYLDDFINETKETDIEIIIFKNDSLLEFLDIYVDNFITDSIVKRNMDDCNNKINKLINQLEEVLIVLKEKYINQFSDCDNEYTQVKEVEVLCPVCKSVHLIEETSCPYCETKYDENITPIIKL